jgi:DinB family protein
MKHVYTTLSLSEILAEAEDISKNAQLTFGHLIAEQINWKPNAESWSVGQCFDHLITTNGSYFPQLDQIIEGKKSTTLWQTIPFLPGLFGRLLINSLNPDSVRKLKAPQAFQPASSNVDPQIISKFAANQNDLIHNIQATAIDVIDLDKVIITSPALKIMTYSLIDAYRIIVAHELRHFKQAQRVMESPGFPL